MKKKLLIALLLIALVLPLAACGATVTEPTRGSWQDEVFTSEYLGLRFALPFGWEMADDALMAEVFGMAEAATDLDGSGVIHDMMAIDFVSGTNIQIIYEAYGRRAPSVDNLISATQEQFEELGARLIPISGTTQIAGQSFYSFATEMTVGDHVVSGRQFFNMSEGYIRTIIITYTSELESPEDFLRYFIGLNDTPPQAPTLAGAPELVGVWSWDMDGSYTYTFNEDGSAVRGFTGNTETFQWYISGNNNIYMVTSDITERWTFDIADGVFTITSRQVPDLTWSYVLTAVNAPAEEPPAAPATPADELNSALFGTWDWDVDASFTYTFNEDGTGTRGIPGNMENFTWHTSGTHLYMDTPMLLESWSFEIVGGVLTIDSNQVPGMTWSYIAR